MTGSPVSMSFASMIWPRPHCFVFVLPALAVVALRTLRDALAGLPRKIVPAIEAQQDRLVDIARVPAGADVGKFLDQSHHRGPHSLAINDQHSCRVLLRAPNSRFGAHKSQLAAYSLGVASQTLRVGPDLQRHCAAARLDNTSDEKTSASRHTQSRSGAGCRGLPKAAHPHFVAVAVPGLNCAL